MTFRQKLLVGASLFYPLLIAAVVYRLETLPVRLRLDVPPGLATPLAIALAVIGVINVTTPWQSEKRWLAGSGRVLPAGSRETRTLLLGLPFAAAPASSGLLLYLAGAGVMAAAIFAAASLVAAAAWGLRGPASAH